MLQPLVINLKILLQKVCKKKFDWDEVISEELKEEWKIMINSFKLIGKRKVPQKIFSLDDVINQKNHNYMDSPMLACKNTALAST